MLASTASKVREINGVGLHVVSAHDQVPRHNSTTMQICTPGEDRCCRLTKLCVNNMMLKAISCCASLISHPNSVSCTESSVESFFDLPDRPIVTSKQKSCNDSQSFTSHMHAEHCSHVVGHEGQVHFEVHKLQATWSWHNLAMANPCAYTRDHCSITYVFPMSCSNSPGCR